MNTSINNQSGGIAAETTTSTPNPNPNPNIAMNDTNDDPVMLKQAAAEFGCAASSLKNNIKSGKLAATQTGEKAPYMVRLSDVECFLRETPGVASIFHPATSKTSPADSKPTLADETPAVTKAAAPPVVATDTANTKVATVHQGQSAHDPDAQLAPSTQSAAGGVKKRRRRRGKGGGGSPATAGVQSPVLKALAGTTPQERLRIAACLTELLGLVASA